MKEVDVIFDWIMTLSEISSKRHMLKIEQDRLNEFERKKCGNCFYWMKSRLCPREKNVKGMTMGPSISGLPCEKFEMGEYHNRLIEKQKSKVFEAKKEVSAWIAKRKTKNGEQLRVEHGILK